MPNHPDRVRRNYDPMQDEAVPRLALTYERDIRTVLSHVETGYTDPDLTAAIRRVRKVVGYDS